MDYKSAAIQLTRAAAKRVAESSADVFVPLYDKFSEKIAGSKTEYFMWDGTHPSIAGHMLIARNGKKQLKRQKFFKNIYITTCKSTVIFGKINLLK